MYNQNNIIELNCQEEVLRDFYTSAKTGQTKSRKWAERKLNNEYLASAYDVVNSKKADRLRSCATTLTFAVLQDGSKKLASMNSCRVRLCPICTWRRSLKNFYNNKRIAEYLEATTEGAWLLVTLTCKNCKAEELSDRIDDLMHAFKLLTKNVKVKKIVRGFYRGLEVTHDCNEFITDKLFEAKEDYYIRKGLTVGDKNPNFDLYHPHFHCLFFVNKSYFTSRDYLNHDKWVDAWQQALGADYRPQVDVRRVKEGLNGISGSIAEVSKYASKSTDYLTDDYELTVDTVRCLDAALANRRLIAYGGEVRAAFAALKLEDADSGDLVDVGEATTAAATDQLVTYFWHTGYRQYIKA